MKTKREVKVQNIYLEYTVLWYINITDIFLIFSFRSNASETELLSVNSMSIHVSMIHGIHCGLIFTSNLVKGSQLLRICFQTDNIN